jgi:serine/threonine protein kinase
LETSDENGVRGEEVAIKRLLHINSNDKAAFRDFIREAELMKQLQHENIVKIYGFLDNPLIIIMEYMPMSLLNYLSIHKSSLRVENLLRFAEDIAKVSSKIFNKLLFLTL